MYRINDRAAAIRTVQRYLSRIYQDRMTVSENGIFDDNTILALNKFQADNGLKIENSVDYDNFDLLYEAYIRENERQDVIRNNHTSVSYPFIRGDRNHELININKMLLDITRHYGHYIPLDINDYFSRATADALNIVDEIFESGNTGEIDEIKHSRIIKEWKSIRGTEYFP